MAEVTDAMNLADRLREFTALRFAGDCKCGSCQLVPRDLLDEAVTFVQSALAARPEPEGMEPVAWRIKVFAEEDGWILVRDGTNAARYVLSYDAAVEPLYAGPDVSRLSAEIASLKAQLAEAEAEKGEVVKAEREACAKIAETDCRSSLAIKYDYQPTWYVWGKRIAAAIRTRGGSHD